MQNMTEEMERLLPLLNEAADELAECQQAYDSRKHSATLNGAMNYKNAEAREAFVGSVLEEEGLTEDLYRARGKWRKLQNEKEFLFEASANLRTLSR